MATKSAKEKNRPPSSKRMLKPSTNTAHIPPTSKSENSKEPTFNAVAACENCDVESHTHKRHTVKKKPMYKLGSWRGAFAGTPDF